MRDIVLCVEKSWKLRPRHYVRHFGIPSCEQRLHILALPRGINVYVKADPPSHNITLYRRLTLRARARGPFAGCPRSLPRRCDTRLVKIPSLSLSSFSLTLIRVKRLARKQNNIQLLSHTNKSIERELCRKHVYRSLKLINSTLK